MNIRSKKFPDPPARLHFIGIKGTAMTGLAELLKGQGYQVSGSDTSEIFPTDKVLSSLNIDVAEGFNANNIGVNVEAVVYSTAYGEDHPERVAVKELGVMEWSYPEMAGILMAMHSESVAIAGSHGKTTTTALLARMLEEGNLDPTVIVGSTVVDWQRSARLGSSSWFVMEADEYQNKFRYFDPKYILITNIDYDHPDYFTDKKSYEKVFIDFVSKLPAEGMLVICGDDPMSKKLIKACSGEVQTYGFHEGNMWRLHDVVVGESGTSFRVTHEGVACGTFHIGFPGEHYALNALGAFILADRAKVALPAVSRALTHYRGTSRRLELKGEINGALIIDDYAHHPTEVTATITALKSSYRGRRLRIIFQPHTFSRTEQFLSEFAEALSKAGEVIVPPIYTSAREKEGKVTHKDLVEAINKIIPRKAKVAENLENATEIVTKDIGPGDLIVTMGAGDVWQIASRFIN